MKKLGWVVLLSCVVAISGQCGGGGGGGGGGEQTADFTGTWAVSGTSDATECGLGTLPFAYEGTMVQTGSSLTFTTSFATFTGTVSGQTATVTGSYPENGGTLSVNSRFTMNADGNSASGSATWTWSNGPVSCNGTNVFTATRNPA